MGAPTPVLIVGGGCTGALVAHYLREHWQQPEDLEIHLWERGRGPGGRMSTTWVDIHETRARADMGAQILSVKLDDSGARALVNLLLKAGVLYSAPSECLSHTAERGTGDTWEHFAGITGLSAVPGHFLRTASANCCWERLLQSLHVVDGMVIADSVHAKRRFRFPRERFHAVCLTMRIREVDEIGGHLKKLVEPVAESLHEVQYDQRFSVALFLDLSLKEHLDRHFAGTWEITPLSHPIIELIAYQTPKMKGGGFDIPVVVIHSTVTFARSFYREHPPNGRGDPKAPAVLIMAKQLAQLIDCEELPASILDSKVLNWQKSQVLKSARLGHAAAGFSQDGSEGPRIVLAGDYFTESSFSGCAKSAFAASKELMLASGAGVLAPAGATGASVVDFDMPSSSLSQVELQSARLSPHIGHDDMEDSTGQTTIESARGRWRPHKDPKFSFDPCVRNSDGQRSNPKCSEGALPRGKGRGRRWQPRPSQRE